MVSQWRSSPQRYEIAALLSVARNDECYTKENFKSTTLFLSSL